MKFFPFYNLILLICIGVFLILFGTILDSKNFLLEVTLCGAALIGHSIYSSIIFSQKKYEKSSKVSK